MSLRLTVLTADECAPLLRALAEPLRLRILSALRAGPLAVFEITERLGIRQYQASRHLAPLLELGAVVRERRGRRVYYSLSARMRADSTGAPTLDLGCCQLRVE